MVTFQQEMLFEIVNEVDDLLQLHYEEVTLDQDRIKLDPMWARYAAIEQAGAFVVYTARKHGKLIGYAGFFINHHLHFADLKTAINDVLFLHPDNRTGRTSINLMRFAEKQLIARLGSFKLVWHAKPSNHLASILLRMGYAHEETILSKHF